MITIALAMCVITPVETDMSFGPKDKIVTTASGLQYADLKAGKGDAVEKGSTPVVNYVLNLEDGKEVDSSKKKDRTPFRFTVGKGKVIKGWEEGLLGMKPGGIRKIRVPYELAYGEKGRPPVIPEKAVLWFTIDLLEVTTPAAFTPREKVLKSSTGLQYVELKPGKGGAAKSGDQVTVHYTLYSEETDVIDSSQQGNAQPLVFVLGAQHVVAGFDEAVTGMKVGGERKVRIPSALGYGEKGGGPIGPNQTLWFFIHLIAKK